MAIVHPPLSCIRPASAGEYAELDILTKLAESLPDAYTLFYSVSWASQHAARDQHGELDIIVVNSAGDVALLEVKAGAVTLNENGIFKRYGGEDKDVVRQVGRQFNAVLHRLQSERMAVRLMHFLVLRDQKVDPQGCIGFPRERIADSEDCLDLPGYIHRSMGSGLPDPVQDRVCAFFLNRLALQTDVSALSGRLQAQVRKISDGLAHWVPRIDAPSGVIRVNATAGSGKTQLALHLLREARIRNENAAYICFNRPLADHVAEIAPREVLVRSFHQLCWDAAGKPQGLPDFAALVDRYVMESEQAQPDLDVLVIDELQDLQGPWVQALTCRLRSTGRLYLLDDPSQCLYGDREAIDIEGAVIVRSQENYRSPQRIVKSINVLGLTPEPVEACSPFEGSEPGFHVYQRDGGSLLRTTTQAIQSCLDKGFSLADIVVLSWRGRESSQILSDAQLGAWRTQCFDGSYDTRGNPNWTDGELRLETLRRFKGQSAPAIVLTEIHFEELGPLQKSMLFVGMTRACLHLELVVSREAETALVAQMSAE